MADNESVMSELSLMMTVTGAEELPLLSALKENGVNGAPYTPVEREQPVIRFMQNDEDPQVRLQSGLVRFVFREKKNIVFMLDFIPKILRNRENWVRHGKTWKKIEKVQAWNLFHLVKFVWSDLMTTDHQLPCGLTHDEMTELLDMCQYADAFKQPLTVANQTRLDSMLKELDFNQRSVKAHENYLRKKAKAVRAAQQKSRILELEARRQRCIELENEARRQREEWERELRESQQFEREEGITLDSVRRVLQF